MFTQKKALSRLCPSTVCAKSLIWLFDEKEVKCCNKCFKATLCDFYPHLAVKRYMTIQ